MAGSITMSWTPPGHWTEISLPMFSAPTYQPVNGGISQTASCLSSPTIASMSLRQNASTYWSSSTFCAGESSSLTVSGSGCLSAITAWARWRAELTAADVVSSASAVSAAVQRSTSRRISTARWRGGRCCRAAMNASRMVSFSATRTAASGTGSSHGISWSSSRASPAIWSSVPSPAGSGRRGRPSRLVRQTLVAIR